MSIVILSSCSDCSKSSVIVCITVLAVTAAVIYSGSTSSL